MGESKIQAATSPPESTSSASIPYGPTNQLDSKPHLLENQGQKPDVEEPEKSRIERLGRQRPEVFRSIWAELGFCYSILASQFMTVSCFDL